MHCKPSCTAGKCHGENNRGGERTPSWLAATACQPDRSVDPCPQVRGERFAWQSVAKRAAQGFDACDLGGEHRIGVDLSSHGKGVRRIEFVIEVGVNKGGICG
jgi:hypothetical protein